MPKRPKLLCLLSAWLCQSITWMAPGAYRAGWRQLFFPTSSSQALWFPLRSSTRVIAKGKISFSLSVELHQDLRIDLKSISFSYWALTWLRARPQRARVFAMEEIRIRCYVCKVPLWVVYLSLYWNISLPDHNIFIPSLSATGNALLSELLLGPETVRETGVV